MHLDSVDVRLFIAHQAGSATYFFQESDLVGEYLLRQKLPLDQTLGQFSVSHRFTTHHVVRKLPIDCQLLLLFIRPLVLAEYSLQVCELGFRFFVL